MLIAVVLAACGGGAGSEDTPTAAGQPATTAAPATSAGPCGLRPLTFTNERWQASAEAPGPGGVLWEQTLTFSNPNTVPVRLSSLVVHLRLSGSGGYFLKLARSVGRPVPDEVVPAGRDQQRALQAWLAPGNTPATEDLYAVTSATVGGTDCPAPVERLSTAPVQAHVLALPSCEPLPTIPPC